MLPSSSPAPNKLLNDTLMKDMNERGYNESSNSRMSSLLKNIDTKKALEDYKPQKQKRKSKNQ
jgi:hypothetical protein